MVVYEVISLVAGESSRLNTRHFIWRAVFAVGLCMPDTFHVRDQIDF